METCDSCGCTIWNENEIGAIAEFAWGMRVYCVSCAKEMESA